MGVNCRGKVTADVLIGGLNVGTWLQGGFEEVSQRAQETRDLPRFRPLFVLEVKTYSCFSIIGCRLLEYKGAGLLPMPREDLS